MQSLCEQTLRALRARFQHEHNTVLPHQPSEGESGPASEGSPTHYWTWRNGQGNTVELCLQERESHCSVRLLARHCEVKFLDIRSDRQLALFLRYLDENVLCTGRPPTPDPAEGG